MKCTIAAILGICLLSGSVARADLLAYYGNGTLQDASALADLAAAADVTTSSLTASGFESGSSITRPSFGTHQTPAGPTAGTSVASEWFFARANYMTSTPSTGSDYFGFTVTADGGQYLALDTLTFDFTAINNGDVQMVDFVGSYDVFVSVDGGAFTSFGSSSISVPMPAGGGQGVFTTPTTESIDLSSILAADSVEIRIALGADALYADKSLWLQAVQLNGVAVPEPSSAILAFGAAVGILLLARFRVRR